MAQPQASSSKLPAQKQVVTLNDDLLGRLKPSKVFLDAVDFSSVPQADRQHTAGPQITSIDFDDSGERCLTTGEDDQIVLWDMRKGRKHKNFWSKKYGCGLGRFTHRAGNILHSSTKSTGSQVDDHAVRYHATHDNKYLAYFKGHTASVRSLQVSPIDDTFISAGDDGTVRMWDLRLPECKGILNDMGGSVVACYDNTGMVFAVGCSATQTVSLYACQQADSPPFETSQLYDPGLLEISVPPPPITITSLSISNNGEYLLVGTSFDFHYLLDAFHLGVCRRLTGHRPLHERSGAEVSFTADSRYVVSGSADGAIYFWDLGTEKMEAVRKGEDGRPVHAVPILTPAVVVQSSSSTGLEQGAGSRAVRFGPRLCVLAVGGQEVSFWLPAKDDADKMEEGW